MLPTNLVRKFSLLAQQKGLRYQEIPKVNEAICDIAAYTAIRFLQEGPLTDAKTTINIAKKFLEEKIYFIKIFVFVFWKRFI
ncbi:MAG: hypothetical protein LBS33_04585 [Streptococcaceae bacterium]|jgi:hypothetical protein|nr:hypothetical protein [Streptococcaceae bacterium]